jgi:hypothetical protein
MFLLDSLMISGISWALRTAVAAAEAEMNDDSALREALLEAEMQREMGEISDDEFADVEADLLARIREIKERREGGSQPLAFGWGEPMETSSDSRFQVEASVSGDFHEPGNAPHTTIVEHERGDGVIVRADEDEEIRVLDMVSGDADPAEAPALPLTPARPHRGSRHSSKRPRRSTGVVHSGRSRVKATVASRPSPQRAPAAATRRGRTGTRREK